MSRGSIRSLVQQIRNPSGAGELRTDAQLLHLFLSRCDQTAFEALVWRHAGAVLGVCRRMLADPHDAEDAFQATFLVLVRKAGSIRQRETLGSWLFRVAMRICIRLRARSTALRFLPLPLEIADGRGEPVDQEPQRGELRSILDEELRRLPERYRAPLILHILQGRTCRDVARELGWPLGTVASRLARGRDLLQQRLTRRGLAPAAGLSLAALAAQASGEAPPALAAFAARAAWSFAADGPGITTRAALLAGGVIHPLKFKFWHAAALLLAVAILGGGAIRALRPEIAAQPQDRADHRPAATAPLAEEWPMFGGTPARNMVNLKAVNLPDEADIATGKNLRWRADLGTRTSSSPVVAGGRVFIGTNNERLYDRIQPGDRGVVMCFDAAGGKIRWQQTHPKLGRANDQPMAGVTSVPTVDGDRIYYLSNRCTVVCARAAGKGSTGEVLWEFDLVKELKVFPREKSPCSPLVAGDYVFAVTSNGVDEGHRLPTPDAPSFVALDKRTGKLVWKDNTPGANVLHAQWSSPAYGAIGGRPQVLFPGGDGWLRAFEPKSGKLIWKFDCNPKDATYNPAGTGTRNDFIAVPVICDGRVYVGTGQDPEHADGVGHLWCIDPAVPAKIPADGDVSPELVTDSTTSPPKVKPNPASALVWHYGGPAKEPAGPAADRRFNFARTVSAVAVHGGLLYAADVSGYFHCLDAKTGKPHWVQDLKAVAIGSPLWADGKVYIGTVDGDLWVFRDGVVAQPPRRIVLDGAIRTTPAAVGGILYVATDTTLFALSVK